MNFEEWAIENGHSVARIAITGEYHCRLTRRAAAAWEAATGKQQVGEVSEGAFRASASRQTASAESNATAEALIAHARAQVGEVQGDAPSPGAITGSLRAMVRNYSEGHRWDHLDARMCQAAADRIETLEAARSAKSIDRLGGRLQQKCVDWNTYWRAPDAHGVNLNIEQALELLRDALGVEVYIDLMMFEPAVDALYSKQVSEYEDGQYGDEELARIEGERFDMMQLIRRTSP